MSGQEEQELRARLGTLLEQAEPRPAPVEITMRHGRTIRMRRRALAAGSLAVAAAAAVAIPSLAGRHTAAPRAAAHGTVTVRPPGRDAAAGLIATGTADGRPWTAVLTGAGASVAVRFTGFSIPALGAHQPTAPTVVSLQSIGNSSSTAYAGPVAAPVRDVRVTLADGQLLSLRPVPWHGRRYVAFVVPNQVAIANAAGYGQHGEIGYAIPFHQAGSAIFVTWLRPGQAGQPRAVVSMSPASVGTKLTDATVVGYAGPWGLCVVTRSPGEYGTNCVATGQRSRQADLVSPFVSGSDAINIGFAGPRVAYLELYRTGRPMLIAPVARIAGYGLFAFPVRSQPIRGWAAYRANGTRIGSGPGNPAA